MLLNDNLWRCFNNSKIKKKNNESLQPIILNEVFSMDSFNTKQLEALAQKIINEMEYNTYITEDEDFYTYIDPLNLPESVYDMIASDWQKPKDDLTVTEILGSPYTKKYLIKNIINEFKNEYHYIESLGNPIKLYRFLNLDYEEGKSKSTKLNADKMLNHILSNQNIHLGLSWTPIFHKAEEFGKDNFDLYDGIIMEINCSRDAINLANTLILRNTYTYFNFENEIELIKSAPILLKKIYKLNNKGNWKSIEINKQYRA